MKKIFLALAAIVTVACFASCDKTCSCTTYAGGSSTESEFDLQELQDKYPDLNIKKCSDLNTKVEVAGIAAGMECK